MILYYLLVVYYLLMVCYLLVILCNLSVLLLSIMICIYRSKLFCYYLLLLYVFTGQNLHKHLQTSSHNRTHCNAEIYTTRSGYEYKSGKLVAVYKFGNLTKVFLQFPNVHQRESISQKYYRKVLCTRYQIKPEAIVQNTVSTENSTRFQFHPGCQLQIKALLTRLFMLGLT